jgi:hypothetical protein
MDAMGFSRGPDRVAVWRPPHRIDTAHTGLTPPHDQKPAASAHLERVVWRGRVVPVPKPELQLAVAERRGLPDRCQLIRQALAS